VFVDAALSFPCELNEKLLLCSNFHVRPSGFFPKGTDLGIWMLFTISRTPLTEHLVYRKADTYTAKHEQEIEAARHPYLEWHSNSQSQC
jgi:hypothetical protein